MKIELNVSQLKEIYRVCGAALDPKNEMEPLRYIHLEAKNGVLHAFASDGYAAVETKTQVQEKEHFVCLLPVVQIPKSAEQVSIQILNGMMDISFSNGVKYTQRAVPPGLYMDVSLVNRSFERDQQKYEIAVNPKLLVRALKGFCDKKEAVVLRFGTEKEPILMDTFILCRGSAEIRADKRMLLLPIRLNYKEANQKLSERTF
ncbi:hypothetical protein [Anaerotignum lactatifermentans]|uniref:hypothetical protein n=1 Tax=Anaerotignum lactatifermentans TaxID=160404 RepID=UPI00266D2F2C|nr:hypothetical protein [Anaerotignum lactatifermentans]